MNPFFDAGKSGFVLDSANELYGSNASGAPKTAFFSEPAFVEPFLSGSNAVDLGLLDHSGSSFSSLLHSGENADAYSYAVERDYSKRQPGWSGHAPSAGKPGLHYRKLWQQITKVQPGQRLQESGEAYSELTVEDLLRIIITLPPSEPVIGAIAPGLAHLDSSALAALLKELSKQVGRRARPPAAGRTCCLPLPASPSRASSPALPHAGLR